jgi:two-component system, sensor histidine kinase and response regulator
MNETKDSASKPVWNSAELLSRVDNDQELLRELLDIFKDDFPQTMESLKSAIAGGDSKATASLSHTLKGMLSNLGVTSASAIAAKIEACANAGQSLSCGDSFGQLQREGQSFLVEIEAYFAGART